MIKMKLLLLGGLIAGSVGVSLFSSPVALAESAQTTTTNPLTIVAGATDQVGGEEEAAAAETTSNCRVEGIGWIICPIVREMSKIVDGAYALVSSMLTVQPLVSTGSGPSINIYNAWQVMRNFANVAFVIAFLIIIFSQLTSVGISNYGIKKMLPRLVIAAILVNVSFWICAAAVDVSNILGSSLNGLFQGIITSSEDCSALPQAGQANCTSFVTGEPGEEESTGTGWAGVAGIVLAATGMTIAIMYATLSALLPALLAAIIAIITVFLVLTLRQALIILLVVISPLAFVAYLLPNTESLYKKWLGLFRTLLLMFPIIALIFGASALASTVVMQSASADNPYRVAIQIMGALIAIIPLAITPVVMKTAGGLLNRFGGIVNNPNKGPADKLRKKAEGYRDFRQGVARGKRVKRAEDFRAGRKFNGKLGNKLFGDASTAAGRADRASASRMFGGAYEANQRDRKRKDILGAYESEAESTYLNSDEGRQASAAAAQAKNRASTAQTNVSAFATSTTSTQDLTDARNAKDSETLAKNAADTFSESTRDLGTRLELAFSKAQLEGAQKQSEKQVEEAKADPSTLNIEHHAIQAMELRNQSLENQILSGATDSAKRVQQQQFNQTVTDNPDVAERIGGVDTYGAQRATSISTSAIHKVFDDAVMAEKTTLSKTPPADLRAIYENVSGNESDERRAAAISMITKTGGANDIIDATKYLGTAASSNPADKEAIKSLQQQFAADLGQRKPTSIGAGALSNMGRGEYSGTFETQIISRLEGGKLTGETLTRTPVEELDEMIRVYDSVNVASLNATQKAQRAALAKDINAFRTDPLNVSRQPAPEIKARMDQIEAILKK